MASQFLDICRTLRLWTLSSRINELVMAEAIGLASVLLSIAGLGINIVKTLGKFKTSWADAET
jgi:hypothetical protein